MALRRTSLSIILLAISVTSCGGSPTASSAAAGLQSDAEVVRAEVVGTARERFDAFAAHRAQVDDELIAQLNAHSDAVEAGDWEKQYRTASKLRSIARGEVIWLDEHRADEVADECWYRVWSRWFYTMTHTKAAADFAMDHSADRSAESLEQFADFIGMAGESHADALAHLPDAEARC